MPYSYLGNEGLVHGLTSGDAFFNRLGASVNEKTFVLCTATQGDAGRAFQVAGVTLGPSIRLQ